MVVLSAQLAVAEQSSVGTLDDPTLRLPLKAPLDRKPFDNLQLAHAIGPIHVPNTPR